MAYVSGGSISYEPPADPGVWYAPQTLLWIAIVLCGALMVALGLWALGRLALRKWGSAKRSADSADYDTTRTRRASARTCCAGARRGSTSTA